MRLKTQKSLSKLVGIWTFLLLLILKGAFPKAALAFVVDNTVSSYIRQHPEQAGLFSSELAPSVAAPIAEGTATTITTTTAAGVTTTTEAAASVAFVGDMRLSGIVAYHLWQKGQNEQAQVLAKQRYCAAYPTDSVCTPFTGGQADGVMYRINFGANFHFSWGDPYSGGQVHVWGPVTGIRWASRPQPDNPGYYFIGIEVDCRGGTSPWNPIPPGEPTSVFQMMQGSSFSHNDSRIYNKGFSIERYDGQPDIGGNPPSLPWKDWSQEKRSIAVASLTNSDWQGLISSMPEGGVLKPRDTIKTPGNIIIPGTEQDDPNTPADERILRKEPGFFTWPEKPDFDQDYDPDSTDPDDDDDGELDTTDPEPYNPNVPVATQNPPPPSSDPPDSDNPLDNWQPGEPLAEHQQAQVAPAKFDRYSMDPNNSNNGGKWRAFEELGYDVQSTEGRSQGAQDVMSQLREKLPNQPATEAETTQFGRRFKVRVEITGPNGKTGTLDTTWQYDNASNVPRLITNWLEVHR